MGNSPVALETSYFGDILILAGILLLVAIVFILFFNKSQKNSDDDTHNDRFKTPAPPSPPLYQKVPISDVSTAERAGEENKASKTINKYTLQETPRAQLKMPTKATLPYTTKEPFEETPGITVEDFINFKGARLLIVEDNKINQKILLSVLKKSGIVTTIANNGEEALEILENPENEFDLVLMDISMPVMDGYTATQKIRENPRFDTLPIVTFTAFAMGKEIERMYKLGVNGHLTKPLNNLRLYTIFHTYLTHIERPLSLIDMLKMKGLDVKTGIEVAEKDEKLYRQKLREFIFLHKGLVDTMPYWIEEHDYDRIKTHCIKLSAKLSLLGAYELDEMVSRMKKLFIYNTQHRIGEFKDSFREKMSKLLSAMEEYLESASH